ncbi:hypothetical protein [Blastococcus sp. SYSU DS0973]
MTFADADADADADAGAAATTATFSAAGSYVLRLTATDGELPAQDEVSVTVSEEAPPQTGTVEGPLRRASNDVGHPMTRRERALWWASMTVGILGLALFARFWFDPARIEEASPHALR